MGPQDLGRHQPDTKTAQPSPIPAESPGAGSSRPAGLAPAAPGGGVDATPRPGQGQGPPQAVPQGRHAPLTRPGRGVGVGRVAATTAWSASGGRGPDAASAPPARPFQDPQQRPARFIGTCQVVLGGPRTAPECLVDAAENPAGGSRPRFARSGGDGGGWEDGGMADPSPPVDLAASPRAGAIPERGGGWTGRTCRPTSSGWTKAIASSRTATTRSRCWWWSSQAGAS